MHKTNNYDHQILLFSLKPDKQAFLNIEYIA